MVAIITRLNLQFWDKISVLLVILIIRYTTTEKVWSGNVQFTDDGWLQEKDVRSIQHEIKMVEIDCGNVCDTTREDSTKVRTGRYGIDELTKEVDCDSLFGSSYLDGINPKSTGNRQIIICKCDTRHVEGSTPRLTDLPEETLYKWTYNGVIPKVEFHVDNQSCPWKDEGPSKGWGLTEFQLFHGGLWKYGPKEYLWTEKLINKMKVLSRSGNLPRLEEGRSQTEKSQFCGGLISYNKLTSKISKTWEQVPYFNKFVDEFFRPGYAFGLHNSIHGIELWEHLKRHILNREGSEEAQRVKHVLVIGSKMPWVEAILLENGVEKITSLVANPAVTRSEHENITVISLSDLSEMWSEGKFEEEANKFDAVIAYNSLGQWHGLGGFGHPGYSVINPWADVLTLTKAWCVSKKQSRALVSLPMTQNFDDLIAFNSGKFYGRVQLANLFTNWKQVPEDYDYYDTMKFEVVENKEQTDSKNEPKESCSKYDVDCKVDEKQGLSKEVSQKYQPVANEIGSFLPIYVLQKP